LFIIKGVNAMTESIPKLIYGSVFVQKLVNYTTGIFSERYKSLTAQGSSIFNLTTPENSIEEQLDSIQKQIIPIETYLTDLTLIPIFLSIKRNRISSSYAKLTEEQYFKYHYDNFIIRIVTSMDICGKIGNTVYGLNIPEKYCNGYSFVNHPAVKNLDCSTKLSELTEYLEPFRSTRHIKIHKGESSENKFSAISFYDWWPVDMKAKMKGYIDILNETTNDNIKAVVIEIYDVISNMTNKICSFLDSMVPKLDELIDEHKHYH
jgi:hypothetical protein